MKKYIIMVAIGALHHQLMISAMPKSTIPKYLQQKSDQPRPKNIFTVIDTRTNKQIPMESSYIASPIESSNVTSHTKKVLISFAKPQITVPISPNDYAETPPLLNLDSDDQIIESIPDIIPAPQLCIYQKRPETPREYIKQSQN